MAVWAIGDIQGCYDELQRLLEQIRFDPAKDRLWFAGDLVNRGPQSLEVLRFVKSLGRSAVTVLGNHDLHLLALSQGNKRHYKHGSLEPILLAKDREELLHWLRHQRVMYHNKKRGYSIIHAGLPPQWDIPTAMQRARELEAALQGPRFHEFCHAMYGNEPNHWSDDLRGLDRLRFIANCFTRLRFCTPDGQLALREKGAPGSADPSLLPWFKVPGRASRNDQIIFGHWSTLGYQHTDNTWCVDSGCLWGGTLTALRPHKKKPPTVQQSDCTPSLTPGDE